MFICVSLSSTQCFTQGVFGVYPHLSNYNTNIKIKNSQKCRSNNMGEAWQILVVLETRSFPGGLGYERSRADSVLTLAVNRGTDGQSLGFSTWSALLKVIF